MVDETEAGKGRATPSRKEAEAARKKQMKTPMTRKEQAKRERAAREEIRAQAARRLKTGDDRYLPAREQGPVRRFTRDYVDRRRNVAEYLLPFLVVLLVLFAVAGSANGEATNVLTAIVYPCCASLGTVLDEIVLVRGPAQGAHGPLRRRRGQGHDDVRGAAQHPAAPLPSAQAAGHARPEAQRQLPLSFPPR